MRRQLSILFLAIFIFILPLAIANADEKEEDFLPIGLTADEMQRLDEIGINHTRTAPPTGVTRNCAEWEPSQGVIIRWPLGISYQLIAEMSEDLMVTTIVGSSSEQSTAMANYSAYGVNMANAEFIVAPTNSIWTRDYGPWFIFEEEGDLAIVDPIYNRPRPLDDVIPQTIGALWGLSVYGMDLEHTGGNHMSNGLGMSMSTRLTYDENPSLSEAEVDSIMLAYLGNDYTVMDYIESGGIHHIDCWAKFLNPNTILVKDVPSTWSSYALLNARADFLAQQTGPWGRPYTIVRIYCPSGTAYTNSVILNDKVLVPLFGSSYDSTALETYRAAMPGYEVLGFTGSFLDDDAIHCRTMGVPDSNMLFIDHVPLYAVSDTVNDYLITARIVDHSETGMIADSLKIFYSVDGGAYTSAPLVPGGQPDEYYGYIPAQSGMAEVSYYLQAADNSGRVETHPFIGEPWAHQFSIDLPPDMEIAEDQLYDSLQAGEESPQFVRLYNHGGGALRVTFSSPQSWLDFSTDEQTVYPNDSLDFPVTLISEGLAYGDNAGTLEYAANDPDTPSGSISVTLHIFAPDILITETSIEENLEGGAQSSYPLVITNNGPGRLDYQIGCQMFQSAAVSVATPQPTLEPIGYRVLSNGKGDSYEPYFTAVMTSFGGPDVYGHSWLDSDDPGGPTFDWIDISAVGSAVSLGDDEASAALSIGFNFPYYDSVYSELYIGSNGTLTFDEANGSRINDALPVTSQKGLIAMFWDDLDPVKGGNIYYYYDSQAAVFVVSFVDIRFYSGSTGTGSLSFQAILHPDGEIDLQYGTMDPGTLTLDAATIGIQNSAADDALQVVNTAAYAHSDLAVQITAEHWLSALPAGGSIDPYSFATVEILFDAAELATGQYTGQVVLTSNDPDDPQYDIPVTLDVVSWVCGDIDGSGLGPDIGDLVYLVDFMFTDGPEPPVMDAANVDGAGEIIDVGDLVYLVDYMFNGGPALICP